MRWPVEYEDYYLVFYFAYYLPAAIVGKIFSSWKAAYLFNYAYNVFALGLIFLWLTRLLAKFRYSLIILFCLFGGLDIFGHFITLRLFAGWPEQFEVWIEGPIYFFSNTNHYFWAPHQSLACWLVTAIVIEQLQHKEYKYILYLTSLLSLWAPFPMLGLTPFILLACYQKETFLKLLNWRYLLAALTIWLILGLFYRTSFGNIFREFWFPTESLAEAANYIVKRMAMLTIEVGIYLLLIFKFLRQHHKTLAALAISCLIFLFAILFIRFGINSDFIMRGSMPGLFLIFIAIAHFLYSEQKITNKLRYYSLIILIVIGFAASFTEIYRVLFNFNKTPSNFQETTSVTALQPEIIAVQYLGRKDFFFFEHLARTKN